MGLVIAVDFDGVLVENDYRYTTTTPAFRLRPGARDGLAALKAAGHVLVLYSCRANLALRRDPDLDPLHRAGVRRLVGGTDVHEARYRQMVEYVAREFPGVFAAVDDGAQGKLVADLYIDDLAMRAGCGPGGYSWREIVAAYGAPFRVDAAEAFVAEALSVEQVSAALASLGRLPPA